MIVPGTPENIRKAAELIHAGKLVSFPTETVYGLAANALDERAVRKIFELKGRPSGNPLIVHIPHADLIPQVAEIPESNAHHIAMLTSLWPGPLSMVLPKHPSIPPIVTAGSDTVAVRVPNHGVALALLEQCGVPLAAPSANRSFTVSPTTAQHVQESFGDALELILDGGPCSIGLESTVVCFVGSKLKILRPGGVTIEQLGTLLGSDAVLPFTTQKVGDLGNVIPSPGLHGLHYAPKTPLAFIDKFDFERLPKRVGLIRFRENRRHLPQFDFEVQIVLSKQGDCGEIANKLFAALREFDRYGLNLILIDSCADSGLGLAIMDRLTRALHMEPIYE